MKKILMFALVASLAVFTACKDDEETFSAPVVSTPAPVSAEFSADVELTFNYTADAGFKSAAVSATNGTAVIKTDGTAGSK
jgi:methionine-rich copper-binding protein CopC